MIQMKPKLILANAFPPLRIFIKPHPGRITLCSDINLGKKQREPSNSTFYTRKHNRS